MPEEVRMFVNGQAMRGGTLNDALRDAHFLREQRTAARYRFYSVRDEFPGLYPTDPRNGARIAGELYQISYAELRQKLLPREPPELELAVIELEDGSGCLSMRMRDSSLTQSDVEDITSYGGWRAYMSGRGAKL